MNFSMKLKKSPMLIVCVLCGASVAYLWIIGQLTTDLLFIFIVIGGVCFLMYRMEKSEISYDEARDIGYKKILEKQKNKEGVISGNVSLMIETEMKDIEYLTENPTLEHDNWDVGVVVDGDSLKGYLVRVSKYGAIMGTSEIDLPSSFRVTNTPRFRTVKATPKESKEPMEKKKEGEEQQ